MECWRDEDPWHVYPDTDPWYISADGLAAARLGDGAQVSAPDWGTEAEEPEPPLKSLEEEAEERRRHREEQRKWDTIWMDRAHRRDWSYPEVPLEAYRHSGSVEEVTADPRKEAKYIEEVLNTLGLQDGAPVYDGLTEDDMNAVREVIRRKASVFWIEGSPRTTLLHLRRDTRPTGPAVRTPPHNLKAEEADFVDEQLEKEVRTGQLERGNSPWGSPPFCTKEMAVHKEG